MVRAPNQAVGNTVLAVLSMLVCLWLGWGFTVDDALISTRVAHHLESGIGYRFNPDGDVVDCVTPLGWAWLLAPASSDPLRGLAFARAFGVACALLSAAGIGYFGRRLSLGRFALVLLALSTSLPLGAWASSGMETPLVMLLLTATLAESRAALFFASLAAALRPELVPFALVLAALRPARSRNSRATNVAIALSLPLLVIACRVAWFGHPAPLAVFAKPSDFESGLRYSLGGLLLLGLPVLLVARAPFRSVSPHVRALALASGAHVVALLVAGGDWMALFRLFVPILPIWVFVGTELARFGSVRALVARSSLATAVSVTLLVVKGPSTRGVFEHRMALIEAARPHLSSSLRVATLDVGWVGATTSAPVVDLAGVTDPEVALLPGGHTSKRLPPDFLLRRGPDTLVLLLAEGVSEREVQNAPWTSLRFARAVEQLISKLEGAGEFVPIATLGLGGTSQRYLVLRRLSDRLAGLAHRDGAWPQVEAGLSRRGRHLGANVLPRNSDGAVGFKTVKAAVELGALLWSQRELAKIDAEPEIVNEFELLLGREGGDVECGLAHREIVPPRSGKVQNRRRRPTRPRWSREAREARFRVLEPLRPKP